MEQQKSRRSSSSIFARMLIFLLAILLLQTTLYLAAFFGGDILKEMENSAFSSLRERTANRRMYLENEMVQRWSNVKEGKRDLMHAVDEVLRAQGKKVSDLANNQELCQEILTKSASDLISMLRRNGVTGAFVILASPSKLMEYPGLYIRDYDPMNYADDNADLLLERGLPQVARQLAIPMDSYWSAFVRFDSNFQGLAGAYDRPVEAARAAALDERKNDYFYRWSAPFTLGGADRPVIAYTTPLVWEDGTVIGVIGVDITVDYLISLLKHGELGDPETGAYFLGITEDGGKTYRTVGASGPIYKARFGQTEILAARSDERDGIVQVFQDQGGRESVYGAIQPLKLYNNNTPFQNEQWALIGMQSRSYLWQFSDRVHAMLLLTAMMTLTMGLMLVYSAARVFTDPISALVGELRRSDPKRPIRLPRINITELDALSGSIEALSNAAVESAARISKIISMSHIPIGVFEYRQKDEIVFCSGSLFELLGWEGHPGEDAFLPAEEFLERLHAVTGSRGVSKEDERVYHITCAEEERWVQLFCREEGEQLLGAFLDVTADMEAKRKIEYERDYDVLTGLYNRRAFDRKMEELLATLGEEELKTAAVLMLDLDNLKYINDSSGHDYGDRYIQALGRTLGHFPPLQSIVGRRSGDEFNVFLYGYDSEHELRGVITKYWEKIGQSTCALPGGGRIRVRASGGVAWYGKDADNYAELLHLADFAMYNVKHTIKGELREFDRRDYEQKSILISGQDALNRMLENRMVRYALQPIVSAVDGSVFGYEFLMRPMIEELSNLGNLFRLAKTQSKLAQIEELTWLEAMSRFAYLARTRQIPDAARAFLNSVSNQYLPEQILEELEDLYHDVLHRVVLEITEGEEPDRNLSRRKKAKIKSWGGLLALDDYGTGYSTEAILVDLAPDIIKVDVGLIRNIDRDTNRLALVRNLMLYAKSRSIKVVAEGVETAGELRTLIACGVDYFQGFYLCRPKLEVPEVPPNVVEEIRALHAYYWAKDS